MKPTDLLKRRPMRHGLRRTAAQEEKRTTNEETRLAAAREETEPASGRATIREKSK
jgi:hypothetical protein